MMAKQWIERVLGILLSAGLLAATGSAAGAQEAPADTVQRSLELGETVSDSLPASAVHAFSVELEENRFVYGEADQQSVDVVVSIFGPDDVVVATFDAPARGPEPFHFTSDSAGTYRIEIAPFERATGRYALALERVEQVATQPTERVDQLLVPYSGSDVPGGVVAVVRDGEPTFAEAYGAANLTHRIPFAVDTRTNIGSTSKQFTAFAIVLLADRGLLSLDDDVREHIPELPDFGETVTLRHLLTHTSGYREFLNTLALAGRHLDEGDYIDREELIDVVRRQPELQNAPGAEWNYNNTGYGLLATVVERVSDQSFPDWMEQNVFAPLEMTSTVVREDPSQIIRNSAQGYLPAEHGWREAGDLSGAMGAGGIYTTVEDVTRWLENFRTGQVGDTALIRRMTTPYVLTSGDTTEYGLGLFVDEYRGLRRIHHGGADIAHRSMVMYFPEIDAGVIALSNNATFSGGIPTEVGDIFLGEHMEEDPEEDEDVAEADDPAVAAPFDPEHFSPAEFDVFAGRYELEAAPGFILAFTREEDRFYTQATGQPRIEIVPVSDSVFELQGVDARVAFHSDGGTADSLTLYQNGEHIAHRVGGESWSPSEEELAAFTGRYFSEELETFYDLVLEEGRLTVRHRLLGDVPLTPATEDTFSGSFPVLEVEFLRDEGGRVSGLAVSNGRTRGVLFERVE